MEFYAAINNALSGNPLGTVSVSTTGANHTSLFTFTINPGFLQIGNSYTIFAVFTGNPGFGNSQSANTVTENVTAPATTTTLTTSNPMPVYGAAVVLTATVVPSSGTTAPTGSVEFDASINNALISQPLGTVSASTTGANHTSLFTFTINPGFLQIGNSYTIYAVFTR
jgi:hypothetical protein